MYAERMAQRFPELRLVRGHYEDALVGRRGHWWLVTPEGQIVDPTKAQFEDQGGDYEPWDETKEEPVGKCMNCGELVFRSIAPCNSLCSSECAMDAERAFNGGGP